jgi:hypothetical protein
MLLKKQIDKLEFIEVMQDIGLANSSNRYRNCTEIFKDKLNFSMGRNDHYDDDQYFYLPKTLVGLELLFKGLVICERDFDWRGGSVASNIKIMQIIRRHSKTPVALRNLDKLIKWTFLNKGSNSYTPFGGRKYSNVGSLSELEGIEETDRQNAINHRELEKMQMESAEATKKIVQGLIKKQEEERKIKNAERYKIFYQQIKQFQAQTDAEKLNDLLSNRISFPINLLPECEWLTIIRNQNLEAADINKLIKLIPKNTTSEIKQIKRFLQILRTPKLI